MQEISISRLGVALPLSFADVTLIAEVQEYLDVMSRKKEQPVDDAHITFLIQRACDDNYDQSAFHVTVRRYGDGSVAYAGKCLRLFMEELTDVLSGLMSVYLESLLSRKKVLLEKIKDDLTPQERANARNQITELERLVKNGQEKSNDFTETRRIVLLTEGPTAQELSDARMQVKKDEASRLELVKEKTHDSEVDEEIKIEQEIAQLRQRKALLKQVINADEV